ncbi:MAG: flagellar basal body P-ring formation chaperone FlgA [Phycisphaerales bacterium]
MMTISMQISTLLVVCAALFSSSAFGQITTVTLTPTVRTASESPLTLGLISTIEGDQASALMALTIEELIWDEEGFDSANALGARPSQNGWNQISAKSLRLLLDRSEAINGSSVIIHGDTVAFRRMNSTTPTPKQESETEEVAPTAPTGPTVRSSLERWIRDRYRTGTDTLKIDFQEDDMDFLSTSTQDRLVEIRELSKRGRTAVRIVVLDAYEISAEKAIIFDVQVYRTVLIARSRVNRNEILEDADFMSESRWVSPEHESVRAQDALGMSIVKAISPGEVLGDHHLEMPMVIRRGDLVSAKSIAGSVVVTVRGRAKSDARKGETVEIESLSGESAFTARAVAQGKVLIIQDRVGLGDRSERRSDGRHNSAWKSGLD